MTRELCGPEICSQLGGGNQESHGVGLVSQPAGSRLEKKRYFCSSPKAGGNLFTSSEAGRSSLVPEGLPTPLPRAPPYVSSAERAGTGFLRAAWGASGQPGPEILRWTLSLPRVCLRLCVLQRRQSAHRGHPKLTPPRFIAMINLGPQLSLGHFFFN